MPGTSPAVVHPTRSPPCSAQVIRRASYSPSRHYITVPHHLSVDESTDLSLACSCTPTLRAFHPNNSERPNPLATGSLAVELACPNLVHSTYGHPLSNDVNHPESMPSDRASNLELQ